MFIENNILKSISPEDIANNALIIPEGVTTILHTAFNRYTIEEANLMDSIKYITVPKTITHIDYGTFNTCPYLTGLIIKNVSYVFNCNLFRTCANLSYIQVGAYKYNILWLEGKHYHIITSNHIEQNKDKFKDYHTYFLQSLHSSQEETENENTYFFLIIPKNTKQEIDIYGIGNTPEEALEFLSMGGVSLSNIDNKYSELSLDTNINLRDYKLICRINQHSHSIVTIEDWLFKIKRAEKYFNSSDEIISVREFITRVSYNCPDNDTAVDLKELMIILAQKYVERTESTHGNRE